MADANEEAAKICRECSSVNLRTDWAAGDLICTDCGIVNDENLRDSRAEWKEFNDDADLAKGSPSLARCGLVPTDESRFIGGLEPTVVSRRPFGGGYGCSSTRNLIGTSEHCKRLSKTSRKIEKCIHKMHREELMEDDLIAKVRAKRKLDHESVISPALLHCDSSFVDVTQDEEISDCNQAKKSRRCEISQVEKWSLERALLLYGRFEATHNLLNSALIDSEQQRLALMQSLSVAEMDAARDVYQSYKFVERAAHNLSLPHNVVVQSAHTMCQYALQRGGFHVRGISSRITKTEKKMECRLHNVKVLNKVKQLASLGAAVLYLTGKSCGQDRSLSHVCSSFSDTLHVFDSASEHSVSSLVTDRKFVRTQMCSKAIAELRHHLPHLFSKPSCKIANVQILSGNTANFVEHSIQSLCLPSEAAEAVKHLALECSRQQLESGFASGTKPLTLCAAATYMICLAGATMQMLAAQAIHSKKELNDAPPTQSKITLEQGDNGRSKCERMKLMCRGETADCHAPHSSSFGIEVAREEVLAFQGWVAWSQQQKWGRDLEQIERASGISKKVILDFYRRNLHPRRGEWLKAAGKCLTDGKGDLSLISIVSAAPLMIPEKV